MKLLLILGLLLSIVCGCVKEKNDNTSEQISSTDLATAIAKCEEKWAKHPDPHVGDVNSMKEDLELAVSNLPKLFNKEDIQRMKKMSNNEIFEAFPGIKGQIDSNDLLIKLCVRKISISERERAINEFMDKIRAL